ncbi:MAG: hypothetical protein IPF92_05635 [Myxococcales bacterium]|nr:hypothetical protein [Myxococcales bacterium]MBL0198051.1 hypothetical protein [Myxococcales bacterium]HQY62087.1 hypothetical protein [Polyangiaceae bacterium]
MRKALALLTLPTLLALSTVGCGSCGVCSFRGTLNEPSSRSMRRSMLQTGLSEFCKQMTSHNAPLKLSDDTPVIGRFYPRSCAQREMSNGDLFVEFQGEGYAYTNVSKKVTFQMQGAVQYNQDFLVAPDKCDVYAYFRPRQVVSSSFQVLKIESTTASFLNTLNPVGETFGRQLVSSKLNEGFTVIHDEDGSDDVSLGIVELGKRPFHAFNVRGQDRVVLENSRTEVHQNQRDFIGPLEVTGDGQAIFLRAQLDGAPQLDLFLVPRAAGDASLRLYLDYPSHGPLAQPPTLADVLTQGTEYARAVPVPKGQYYVIIDNTPSAGVVNPPANLMDDRAAVVNYAVSVGEAP